MAKMFYTMQEAAQKLGVKEDEVRQLASSGQLQIFRDRDKMMFKRDQVDELAQQEPELDASAAGSGVDADLSGTAMSLDATDADASGTGLDIAGDSAPLDDTREKSALDDSAQGSGVSVFETGEVDSIDPLAQTQVTDEVDGDDGLVLESIGSGSGLLDLTHEGDDTSLGGADLLDEISLGDSAAGASAIAAPGASGAFESALEMDGSAVGMEGAPAEAGVMGVMGYPAEPDDPAGSGLSTGVLLMATICLIMTLIVAIYAVAGVNSALTTTIAESLWVWVGGLLVGTGVFAAAGYFVGKMADR